MSCPIGQHQALHVLSASSTSSLSTTSCPRHRHLISGTFNSNFLHILSFDTLTRTLSLLSTLPAYGPHSFLTPGRTSGATAHGRLVDTVYATTWADKKELCAWKVRWQEDAVSGLEWLGNVPITATSSYVHVQPPPYGTITTPAYGVQPGPSRFLYSAGGPTGEVHTLDTTTGAIRQQEQEIVFLPAGREALAEADKTRKALRYGAHSVDIGLNRLAFIADVGRNAILTYRQDVDTGTLTLLSETRMPSDKDGPRHVVPSPCGRFAYSVTEHTSFVDVYAIRQAVAALGEEVGLQMLHHVERVSIVPKDKSMHNYRGDTVRVSPDGRHLFATTRGMHVGTRGYVKVWEIDERALDAAAAAQAKDGGKAAILHERQVYETRNSGGKAHAIEFAPCYGDEGQTVDWAVLTDDEQGYVTVLQWDGKDLRDAATIQLPPLDHGEPQGASQAIWLS